jgi:superfamily II DNA/RNA helicase
LTQTTPQPEDTTAPAEELPIAAAASDDTPDQPPDQHDDDEPVVNGFADLGLSPEIVRAVGEKGYLIPTPIQAQAIPYVLMGRDILGCAQTGTGKTAGFTLPMIDILSGSRARARMPRSLILEPTRELALQVAENFVEYGKHLKLTHALVIGGESMSDQKELLMRGVDVLIATPGRLIDMFERGSMLLTDCRVLVIDEADRMLDMGFIPDVERIVSLLPANRQTLFFSATMAPEIRRLADAFLQNPKEITVSRPASVATTITEGLVLVAEIDKREALRRLIRSEDVQNALIFCNRKVDVDILYKSLSRHGFSVGALHGDMVQSMRFATLEKFKAGEIRLLCCSDVAARGIDIGGLSHVFNFDVPNHAEDYVHRIGRTGRAGREGRAFTLAMADERLAVEAIEKLTGHPIPRVAIPGLDPVEWAEGDGRRRGRGGRKPAAKSSGRGEGGRGERSRSPKPTEAGAADSPPAEARAPRPPRAPRAPRAVAPAPEPTDELPGLALAPAELPPELAPQPDLPDSAPPPIIRAERRPGRDRPSRDSRSRDDKPRGERPREEKPREERPREERSAREERPRDDRPRDDRPREHRRRDDDLGPAVRGFGDDIPAFMLIPARRRPETVETEDTEA